MNRIILILITSILLNLVFSGCENKNVKKVKSGHNKRDTLAGAIRITGAFALYPLISEWGYEFHKLHPKVRVHIMPSSSNKGLISVLNGQADLGMYSKEIHDSLKEKNIWIMPVARDAVLPVINAANPYIDVIRERGISLQEFNEIFISGKIRDWSFITAGPKKEKMTVFTRSDLSGGSEMWAEYLGSTYENLQGTGVYGDPGMVDAILHHPGGIGYCNMKFIFLEPNHFFSGIEVVPVDLNGNGKVDRDEDFYRNTTAIADAYRDSILPSPPVKDLYILAKEKPQKEVVRLFIEWINENGLKAIREMGYIEIKKNSQ